MERDDNNQIVWYWNARLRREYSKPINPEMFYTVPRRHYYTGGIRNIKVWACTCGNLTEEKED